MLDSLLFLFSYLDDFLLKIRKTIFHDLPNFLSVNAEIVMSNNISESFYFINETQFS